MCGIFGIINKTPQSINKQLVAESAHLMSYRGPDAFGQWGIDNEIELAHLRLSILDLSEEGNQPFFSTCGRYVIVFNGEIYNYIELRSRLKDLGCNFHTQSDTEVLVNAYIIWGEECVQYFNGDWAFAIYDIKSKKLFCSRDRFGVKPFNYAIIEDNLIFSSEIKSILNYYPSLRKPNYNVISNFCRNSLGAHIPETWFSEIMRLLPGHNLVWEGGSIRFYKYWEYPTNTDKTLSFDQACVKYKNLFEDAVRLRMRSDVAVGTTLSSGIDSSSIVSVIAKDHKLNLAKHKTFTATFNNSSFDKLEKQAFKDDIQIDESIIVKQLSNVLGLDSTFVYSADGLFTKELADVIFHLESGHSSYATLPLSRVLNEASKEVTVVMEGQGADELLGGYVLKAFPYLILEHLKNGKFLSVIHEFNAFRKNYSIGQSIKLFVRLVGGNVIEKLYRKFKGIDNIFGSLLENHHRIKDYPFESKAFDDGFNKALFKSHTGGLVNLLHYGDAISMSKSMESRNPFVDVNLVEFCFKLPYHFKMKNGLGKYIHRKAMKGVVPDFILDNPIKFGFITPLSIQFGSYDTYSIKILMSERCLSRGIYNKEGLIKLIDKHIEKHENHSPLLFRLLSVELWFRIFIDQNREFELNVGK